MAKSRQTRLRFGNTSEHFRKLFTTFVAASSSVVLSEGRLMARRRYKQFAGAAPLHNAAPSADVVGVRVPPTDEPTIDIAAQPDEARLPLRQRVAELEAAERMNAAARVEALRQHPRKHRLDVEPARPRRRAT